MQSYIAGICVLVKFNSLCTAFFAISCIKDGINYLNDNMWMLTPIAMARNITLRSQWSATEKAQYEREIQTRLSEITFALSGICLCSV